MSWKLGVSALLALGAQAGGIGDMVAEGYLTGRSPRTLESRVADTAHNHVVISRQLPMTAGPATPLNPDGTINMVAWNEQTNAACIAALSKLPRSSNPSGTCTCYNLPALNNATGAFQADLRLYQISAARDDFVGIPPSQIQVSLSYNGASVSPVNSTAATAAAPVGARQAQSVQLLQTYMFVGQVDPNRLTPNMDDGTLEVFVTPLVTLSATNAVGKVVSTTVSSNEAVFLSGAFTNSIVLSATAQAQLAVDSVVAGLANNTIAFVLPGVNLLIFPVGLIITGTWFLIGISVIGFGFFERVQYRESYRRRAAIANKGQATKRI